MLINLVRNAVDAALEQAQSSQAGTDLRLSRQHALGALRSQSRRSWSRTTASACSTQQCVRAVLHD